ncbi:HK97 gp10 family phage protein, partial [Oscillibacter sp.]|uniref:HK97 gp10 family phage protein n=1 Tax=Oscillibacter sp. TaxID=1945593 RepID=UPI00262134E7
FRSRRTPVGETIKEEGEPKTLKNGKVKKTYITTHMGGTLRRGWTAKTEQEAAAGGGNADGVTYAKSLPVVHQGNEFIIEIVNPVHYASYVEYGHRQTPGRYVPAIGKRLKASWVKGRFMLTISEQELQAQSPALLEKKLIQFLGEHLNGQ